MLPALIVGAVAVQAACFSVDRMLESQGIMRTGLGDCYKFPEGTEPQGESMMGIVIGTVKDGVLAGVDELESVYNWLCGD